MEIYPPQGYTVTNSTILAISITAVTSSAGSVPTGNVTLYLNGKAMLTAPVAQSVSNSDGTVNATATFVLPLTDIGPGNTANIYGVYGGDSNYQGGQSPSINITDPGPTFTLATTVTVAGTSPVTATVTISTTGTATAALIPSDLPIGPLGGAALGGILFLWFPRRRRSRVLTSFATVWMTVWMTVCLAVCLTSCSSSGSTPSGTGGTTGTGGTGSTGGGTSSTPGTTPGTYTVTLTGTAPGLSPVTTTATITVQ